MSVFDSWKNNMDLDDIRKDAAKAEEQGDYKEVPAGKYEVKIDRLELGQSKKGDPMFICWFKILDGEYKNSMLFMNQVLAPTPNFSMGQRIGNVNKFLKTLDADVDVEFIDPDQWENMIMDVFEAIDGKLEYIVEYETTKSGFPKYTIKDVFEA